MWQLLVSTFGTLINCLVAGNQADVAGGLGFFRASITNCTVTGNRADIGAAFLNLWFGDAVNTIVWNGDEAIDEEVDFTFSDVGGGWEGEGNIDADPVFVDPGHWDDNGTPDDLSDDFWIDGDYRLQEASPCANTGDPGYVAEPGELDLDGQDRVQHCRVDMGAYETSYLFDCNSNGVGDTCDVAEGTSLDCDGDWYPDDCEPDCNTNGVADDCDIVDETSPDCNLNGVPDECEPFGTDDCNSNGVPDLCDIYFGLSQDCNDNGVLDACDIADGLSEDCDSNGMPDECEPDCNSNGIVDACDILYYGSEDCDDNGVPDECEPDCNSNGIVDACDIMYFISEDCNSNQVPDECDIADGVSEDCNLNTIPDECDLEQGTSPDCNVSFRQACMSGFGRPDIVSGRPMMVWRPADEIEEEPGDSGPP